MHGLGFLLGDKKAGQLKMEDEQRRLLDQAIEKREKLAESRLEMAKSVSKCQAISSWAIPD